MIIFENSGLVPLEAFTTFGMSSKPGSTNPIGKFGTGLKYAVAVTLRLGGKFRLWRGKELYEFYTKEEEFRGKTFAKVRMKRRSRLTGPWSYHQLPFTTELGKHWKPWMAVRELEANCRDEGGESILADDVYGGVEGKTFIEITCPEMEEAFADLESIFLAPDRMPIYADTSVNIYEGESKHIFYRGMRVTDLRLPSLYTYEMKHVHLTEDRTSMYSFLDDRDIMRSLLACPNHAIIDRVVKDADDHHESTFDWDQKKPAVSASWIPVLSRSGITGRFAALRDNLEFSIGDEEEVALTLKVGQWVRVIGALRDADVLEEAVVEALSSQLKAEGWKEVA